MNLIQAIIEQWNERFSHDKSYADGKIKKVNECETTSDLIYLCMNIDVNGREIIANKLEMTPRDFAFFLSQFRALDQNNFYSGTNGFTYEEKELEVDEKTIVISESYPDGTVVENCFERQTL